MKSALATFLLCLCCAAVSGAQTIQISAGYQYAHTQAVGGNSSVGFNGGRADVSYGLPRHFSMVGEYSGSRSNLGNSMYDMTLLTYMFGPRVTIALADPKDKAGCASKDAIGRPKCFNMFFQFLVGGAHASGGAFPQNGQFVSSANSIAMSGGGGLAVNFLSHTSVRLIQVDYLTTALPNLYNTHQNYVRVGAGVVLRLR